MNAAYIEGAIDTFKSCGLSKEAAQLVVHSLTKQASLFNFGNGPADGLFASDPYEAQEPTPLWKKLILPLLLSAATGYIGYRSGIEGSQGNSAMENIAGYLRRSYDKLIRTPVKKPAVPINAYM